MNLKNKILLYLHLTCLSAILTVINPLSLFAQADKIAFEHIKTVVSPSCIIQDTYGFIWFGSKYEGLYRYDGYDLLDFRHNSNDPASLSDNAVKAIAEDSDGNLWVGTIAGLNKFDRATGKFQRFICDSSRSDSPSHDYITSIFIDNSGVIWFGTQEGGLNEAKVHKSNYDGSDSLVCRHYLHDPDEPTSISHNNVHAICQNSYHNSDILWIGTASGLNAFDRKTKKFMRYFHDPDDSTSLSHNEVWSIFEDSAGEIWIGTASGGFCRLIGNEFSQIQFRNYNIGVTDPVYTITGDQSGNLWLGTQRNGLYKFNKQNGKISSFSHNGKDPKKLAHPWVNSVIIDKLGSLWVGRGHGFDKYDPLQKKFEYLEIEPPPNKWAMEVTAFCEDRFGYTWIGTWGRGVLKFDLQTGQITNYVPDEDNPNSLCQRWITTIYEDKDGMMWIGTPNGLDRFNHDTKTFHHFNDDPSKPDNPNTLISDYIYALYEDRYGAFWIATSRSLSKLDRTTGRFTHYLNGSDNQFGIAGHYIGAIHESRNHQDSIIWIGANGLYQFHPKTGNLTRYFHNPDNPDSWINQMVFCIHEDKTGNLWVATFNGLFLLGKHKYMKRFTEKDGLPSNHVYGILEDDEGFLWISTFKGLSKYNPQSYVFRQYEMREGFLKNEFIAGSYYKGKSGRFYFGQANGFRTFLPENIRDNPYPPPVQITSFKVFDKPVIFERPIPDVDEIRLSYRQNFFSFDFVALNYTNTNKNQYAYMLEGIDPDWVYSGTRRQASYTNVPPGKYVFRAKGSNDDGVWNEQGTAVRIIITPPWWRTNLAYLVYGICILAVLFGLWQTQIRRIHLRNELTMKSFEAKKLQEIDQMKSRFFANISHEFRTPLTLIQGPIKQILSGEFKGNLKEQYRLILRNAQRLSQLIGQLLDLSKLEAGRMTLLVRKENIVPSLKRIVMSFTSLAERRHIKLKFNATPNFIEVYFDRDKLEKILNNLLSNAFKFTPDGGKILVEVSTAIDDQSPKIQYADGFVQITVSDSGSGIPVDRIEKIFDRFYQADDSSTRKQQGTGIGLALTKELVELHGGDIIAQNNEDKGATFLVRLPLGKKHLKTHEIIDDTQIAAEEVGPLLQDDIQPPYQEIIEDSPKADKEPVVKIKKQLPILLIVEDNQDMRAYLRDFLKADYRLKEATNGFEGFKIATEVIPDLIISDVMMPEMDGFELSQKLKTDERTSHIPIILLTARASEKSKLQGLETGVDDYVIKPFSAKELKVRVKNLIEQRRKLRERFSREITLQPEDIAIISVDEIFLKRVIDMVEQNISNPDFTADAFAHKIGMSRVQLHRKLKALTNQSTTELIRALRLKRATLLLKQKFGNIAQVAYEVGFNNLSYFTQCFRKQFGKLPSEYSARDLDE